jgi:hypothetical protein
MNTYTQEQLDIALTKQKNESFNQNIISIEYSIEQLDSKITWVIGLISIGFLSLLGIMAHGFNLLI